MLIRMGSRVNDGVSRERMSAEAPAEIDARQTPTIRIQGDLGLVAATAEHAAQPAECLTRLASDVAGVSLSAQDAVKL